MYVVQYALLFVAGILLSTAAYTRDHVFAAFLGVFVWFVIGNASAAVVFFDGAGARHVQTSVALTWLCYLNAAVHAFLFIAALREALADRDTDPESPDELSRRVDTGDLQDSLSQLNVPGQQSNLNNQNQ